MQIPRRASQISFGGPLTPTVKLLIIINSVIFIMNLIAGPNLFGQGLSYQRILVEYFGISPQRVFGDFALWQLASYLFIHIEFFHLLFNMLALWWFGSDLEAAWGAKKFIRFYFFTGIGAGVVSAILGLPTIGASGAVFGLLLWFGMTFPNRLLYLYFVIPVKAKYCVAVFGGIELVALLSAGEGSRINHAAHLSGIAFGLIFLQLQGRSFNLKERWKAYRRNQKRKKFKVLRFDDLGHQSDQDDPPPTIH